MRPTLATPRDAARGHGADARRARCPTAARYALAPQLAPLKPLFDAGELGVLLNVGTLVQPTTKAQYTAKRRCRCRPSCSPTTTSSRSGRPRRPRARPRAGAGASATCSCAAMRHATFTCITVSGNAVFLSGKVAVQYQVSSSGPVRLSGSAQPLYGSQACSDALAGADHRAAHAPVRERIQPRHQALDRGRCAAHRSARRATGADHDVPRRRHARDQLQMVARMIQARSALGAKRQVFFVSHRRLRPPRLPAGAAPGAADAGRRRARRVPRGHRRARRGGQRDRVHRLGLRPHAELQRRRLRPRLGQPPLRGRRRRARPALLRHAARGREQRRPTTSARGGCCPRKRSISSRPRSPPGSVSVRATCRWSFPTSATTRSRTSASSPEAGGEAADRNPRRWFAVFLRVPQPAATGYPIPVGR